MKKHFAFILLFALFVLSQEASAQEDPYAEMQFLLSAGRNSDAFNLLDSLEKSGNQAQKPVFQYYKADCMLMQRQYEETIRICSAQISKLKSRDTLLPHFYFLESLAYEQTGKRTQAIEALNKAIRLRPEKVAYYINASFYYGEEGDYKRCLANLRKAIALEPQNVSVLNNLSYYSSMNQQYEQGLQYANAAMKFARGNAETAILLNNRGFAYLGMKNYDAATSDINDALRLYPENPYAYFNKALLYMHFGNNEAVCENLQMATLYGYIYSLKELTAQYCK